MNRKSSKKFVNIDCITPEFIDPSLAPNAGLMPIWLMMKRIGFRDIADDLIDGEGRPGGANPGNKMATS